jgi:hypothetical protein
VVADAPIEAAATTTRPIPRCFQSDVMAAFIPDILQG